MLSLHLIDLFVDELVGDRFHAVGASRIYEDGPCNQFFIILDHGQGCTFIPFVTYVRRNMIAGLIIDGLEVLTYAQDNKRVFNLCKKGSVEKIRLYLKHIAADRVPV